MRLYCCWLSSSLSWAVARASLAGAYILRDPNGTEKNLTLPSGPHEVLLSIADRDFFTNGSLYYPDHGEGSRLVWVPGHLGETVTVNGKVCTVLSCMRYTWTCMVVYSLSF